MIMFLVLIMTFKVELLKAELLKVVQLLTVVMILKEKIVKLELLKAEILKEIQLLKVVVLNKTQKLTKVELLVVVKLPKKIQKEIWFQNQEILNYWVLKKHSRRKAG